MSTCLTKKQSDNLLPHHSYDCPIDLQAGTEVPFRCIYSFSVLELQALWRDPEENLQKGFICPSMSSVGPPIIFVAKKNRFLWPCLD